LKALGFFSGAADGDFGPRTQAAVIAAQRKLNLTADGIVGNGTWTALQAPNNVA
jgi:N-acetylmuramoyl-L-alanine amidase